MKFTPKACLSEPIDLVEQTCPHCGESHFFPEFKEKFECENPNCEGDDRQSKFGIVKGTLYSSTFKELYEKNKDNKYCDKSFSCFICQKEKHNLPMCPKTFAKLKEDCLKKMWGYR